MLTISSAAWFQAGMALTIVSHGLLFCFYYSFFHLKFRSKNIKKKIKRWIIIIRLFINVLGSICFFWDIFIKYKIWVFKKS